MLCFLTLVGELQVGFQDVPFLRPLKPVFMPRLFYIVVGGTPGHAPL